MMDDTTLGRITTPKIVSTAENKVNLRRVLDNWHLGPAKASPKPGANLEFWGSLADIWGISEPEARRQLCANCEYFENTPEMMRAMEKIPFDTLDADGGGRGYCHKFDFICHNLRTCQAWERKDYEAEE
jgi:hypothetical protein